MNLEATEEQRELRATVRRFLAEHASVADHVRPWIDGSRRPDVWNGLVELGAIGLLISEEFGGAGLSMSDAVIIAEEAGAALLPEPWLSSAVAAPRAVQRFGARATAADLLTRIADGTIITTVVAADTLHGDIEGVRDAGACDVVLIAVPHAEGEALYRVDTAAPEVSIIAEPGIDPTRNTFRVSLTDAPTTLLGTASHGATAALIDDVFTATAADALGAAQRLLDTVVEYAKTRTQFGQPIGSFQSVAHLCADMFETLELARSGVLYAAWAADEAGADERHLAAWRLKAFAGRLASIGDTAIQVFGGIGFTWEHDAHRHLKRLLSWSSLLGGSDPYLVDVGQMFVKSIVGGEHR